MLFLRPALALLGILFLTTGRVQAQDRLCDPGATDCRQILVNTLRAERAGLDVAFWFMEDDWMADEVIRKHTVDRIPVRVIVDPRANVDYRRNGPIIDRMRAAGIPMRERFTGGILHWKMMLFHGQNLVQFSGANYSSDAWLPATGSAPYTNYTDEAILFSIKPSVVGSFRRKYDDLWMNTQEYRDFGNVTNRQRVHTAYNNFPMDPELNFAPAEGYANRAIQRYNAETQKIDVIMYRITDDRHVDALIAAHGRNVPIRVISEPLQYRNRPELRFRHIRHSYNIDRLHMAGIPVRHRTHAGLNHQKSILLYNQNMTIFGSSNWTSSSDLEQEEHNLFTSESWIFDWFVDQFDRKWNNEAGVSETGAFAPEPPDQPSSPLPATGATAVATNATLQWHAGPYAYTYDLYLGTTNNPPLVAANLPLGPSTSETHRLQHIPQTALIPGTTYYWRVVGRTAANLTASSPTWVFTTAGTAPPPPPPVTVVRGPYLQQVTSTAATVVWATRDPGAGQVRATAGGSTVTANAVTTVYAASATGMASDYHQHEARLSGLTPGTTYSYDILVGGVDVNAQADTLATAPAPGTGTVTFVAIGDSGTGSAEQRQIAALLDAQPFDLMLHGGDIVYGHSGGGGQATHQTMHDWFFSVYGNSLRTRPVFPSIGNHDSDSSNGHGRPYLDMFVLPTNGSAERYYSFDYGPLHVVVLDTELAFQDSTRRAAQIAWLESDLAATSQPWKVAVFHRPPFNAGTRHGSDLAVRAAFSPVFEEYGVQAVITAHEHTYERSRPWRVGTDPGGSPVTYIVTGGGGAPLYPAGTAEWTAVSASRHHYTRGTATTCTLALEAIDNAGLTFDSVLLDRCGSPPDTLPPGVSITAPATGATVQGNVTITASASDNVGVARTELLIDGVAVAQDHSAPYSFSWTSTSVANGSHHLVVRAFDAAGNSSSSGAVQVNVQNPAGGAGDIVLYAADATVVRGAWRRENDPTAAGGVAMYHPDAGVYKLSSALASPTHYFELPVTVEANVQYRLWARIRAQSNAWNNESVFVQFSPGSGTAFPIGTTSGAEINLEDCSGCGVSGWGWQDNAWGPGVEPNPVVFSTSGVVTLRVQTREDGTYIDQIYLKRVSPAVRPGALRNDTTIYPRSSDGGTPPPDTQAPGTSIIAPASGSTVSGTVSVTASASDNVGVTRVEILLDGVVAANLTAAPYSYSWNTAAVANGSHTLQSRAFDAAGLSGSSTVVTVTVANGSTAPAEIVLYATDATVIHGAWRRVTDPTAAGGEALHHPNAGVGKLSSALASPTHYFELTFTAQANVPYHLWARLRAENDAYNNESVFVQFSPGSGTAFPIGTTSGAEINLEDCYPCGVSGWGWQDNAWGVGVQPDAIVFSTGGVKTLRVQTREDGVYIDQIVLSPALYLSTAPGPVKDDTTVLQRSSGGTPPSDTQPPVTTLSSPAAGATVNGTVSVTASASDNVGVTRVELLVDGAVSATRTTSPYVFSWNTAGVTNGSHTLQSRAYDAAGLSGASAIVTVSVNNTTPAGLPSPWQSQDIGSVGVAGSASASGGTFTVRASGADIWGAADALHYVWQPVTGDVDIVARVATVESVHSWTKAGVMIRESLTASARHAAMFVTPGRGLAFQRRVGTGGESTNNQVAGTAPEWIRLERRGGTITASHSADGVAWTVVGSDTVSMGAAVYVGLALTSHDNTRLAAATYDQITVTPR